MCDKKEIQLEPLNKIQGAETNPFVLELKGKMYLQPRANTIIARGQEIIDTSTGEILQDDVLIGRRRVVDKSQFAKLYASEIGMLFELTRPAVNVFLHLTKVMDYDNKALFDYNKEHQKLGYKSNVQPLKGIRELIGKGIIYPHIIQGVWWLNPTLVCKGERFAKYTEYVTQDKHDRDLAKTTRAKMLQSQGKDFFETMNEATDGKIETMNEAEEKKEREKYERERNTHSLFPELENTNPFNDEQ